MITSNEKDRINLEPLWLLQNRRVKIEWIKREDSKWLNYFHAKHPFCFDFFILHIVF